MWIRIFAVLASVVLSACSPARTSEKNLTFYNADSDKVELKEFSGVNLYHGKGPSNFGETILHPKTPSGMHTVLNIELKYPIKAVYRVLGSEAEYTVQEMSSIENVEGDAIESEGTLVALFENGSFRLIFFEGVFGFSKQDLDRMFGSK